jgi:hypothetical protein
MNGLISWFVTSPLQKLVLEVQQPLWHCDEKRSSVITDDKTLLDYLMLSSA